MDGLRTQVSDTGMRTAALGNFVFPLVFVQGLESCVSM